MKTDANKGINGITYNHLNLPTQVTINNSTDNGNIQYIYDATGAKLKKIVSTGSTTEYAGNYIYENGSLKFFNTAEGYAEPVIPSAVEVFRYVYQYKDHLGNIRLSYSDTDGNGDIDAENEIIEENNYYPFGLKHKGYNFNVNGIDHPYGYNGMEENDELGLDWIDYGARNYDASLGRWMNLDPLAEMMRRHSPYNYAFNNPIRFIDPDGMMAVDPNDEEKESEEQKNVKVSDLPKASNVESFLKGAINFLKDGDKITGEDLKNFINADNQDEGGKFINNIFDKVDNLIVNKSEDGKIINLVFNTESGEDINESAKVDGNNIKIKSGKSSLRIKDEGDDGVSLSMSKITAKVGVIPIPVSSSKTTIKENTLKSLKVLGIGIINNEPLGLPENLKQ